MPSHAAKSHLNLGFLLIEIMCALLLLTIAGSIMAFYAVIIHKQQKNTQIRLEALVQAQQAIDQLKEGFKPKTAKDTKIKIMQTPVTIIWDDGCQDQVWVARVQVEKERMKPMVLNTLLERKAL